MTRSSHSTLFLKLRPRMLMALSSTILGAAVMIPLAFAAEGSGWSTTKVAEGPGGGYCALSRKVDDIMVTVGRSVAGQSSLALEFTKGKLDPQKTYRLSVKPGSADRLEIESKPVSPTTFVLNLDQVVDLRRSFLTSPTLQVRYDDQSMALGLPNWDMAAKEMDGCLSALSPVKKLAAQLDSIPPVADDTLVAKPKAPVASVDAASRADDVPALPAKVVSMGGAEKIERAIPTVDSRLNDLQMQNDTLRAKNHDLEVALTDLKKSSAVASDAPRNQVKDLQDKIHMLEAKNADLEKSVQSLGASATTTQATAQSLVTTQAALKAAQDELVRVKAAQPGQDQAQKALSALTVKATMLETENKTLKDQVSTKEASSKAESAAREKVLLEQIATLQTQLTTARLNTQAHDAGQKVVSDLTAKVTSLETENKTLKSQMAVKTSGEPGAGSAREKMLLEQVAALQAQVSVLQVQAKPEGVVGGSTVADTEKIKSLQADLERSQDQVADLKSKLDASVDKPISPDLADLQNRNEALASENVKLRAQVAEATVSDQDMKVSVAAEQPLRQQLRTLQSENTMLRARNDELMDQLDKNMRGGEKALLSASGKNWDLEQATRRYQEAEREIQRLSLTLREERSKCTADKKQIEYMLFDPKVAKDGQIALLNSLEDEIASLKAGKCPIAVASAAPVGRGNQAAAPAPLSSAVPARPFVPNTPSLAENVPPVMGGGLPSSKQVMTEALAAPADVAAVARVDGPVSLTGLLRQAGVTPDQGIAPVARNPFGDGSAFRWESGELAGMAVIQKDVKMGAFDQAIQKRLKTFRSSCKGDFAAQPAAQSAANGFAYAAYDVACISGANSTSAAVLFYHKDGVFNILSNESAPDDMAKAMEARDRLLTTLGGRPS